MRLRSLRSSSGLSLAAFLFNGTALAADQTAALGSSGEMTDIIDIKPPLEIPFDPALFYYLGAALVLAVLIAAIIWYLRRKFKKADPVPEPVPPHVRANAELDSLARDMDRLSPREFYFRLSTAFRAYLEERFHFPALEMTTEELSPRLDALPLDPGLLVEIKAQSRRADPVKFAGFSAGRETMTHDLGLIKDLVSATEPGEEDV